MKHFIIALALALAPLAAYAQGTPANVEVTHVWARATPGGAQTGAIYLTIKNGGTEGDRLVGASTPAAAQVQLHTEINDNGVMKMRPISAIDLKPGTTTVLKPGGMHVMLIGLNQPLKEGQSFPLTLDFEKAGKKEVQVTVAKAGAQGEGMGHMDMGTMDMGGMKK